ncbi:MAG: serine/threonine-protein kinase, partial [Proteobacteria bacterium]|nr:serine/threonine-protein kinase [Pseudomonadota bacterium]
MTNKGVGIKGQIFGHRYECIESLGQGGMATVYLAYDKNLKRQVAIKVMHEHMQDRQSLRVRFRQEAYLVSKLKHPNILEIYDFSGEDSQDLWLVMEYIDGCDLNVYVARWPQKYLHYVFATCIIREVAKALSEAHDHDIIHRDVKASNIMVSESGQIKLMDFGIAKDLIVNSDLTLTGSFIGSPSYMSPEQIRGETIDARADIYGVCVLFFKLITGKLPYEGETTHDIMDKVLNQPVPRANSLNHEIPGYISHFITKGLAKKPHHRHQTIGEVVQTLANFLARENFGDSGVELALCFSNPKEFGKKLRKLKKMPAPTNKNQQKKGASKKSAKQTINNKKPNIDLKQPEEEEKKVKKPTSKNSAKPEKKHLTQKGSHQTQTKVTHSLSKLNRKKVAKLIQIAHEKKPKEEKKKTTLKTKANPSYSSPHGMKPLPVINPAITHRVIKKTLNKPKSVSTIERKSIRSKVKQHKLFQPGKHLRWYHYQQKTQKLGKYKAKPDNNGWLWVVSVCFILGSSLVAIGYHYGHRLSLPLWSQQITNMNYAPHNGDTATSKKTTLEQKFDQSPKESPAVHTPTENSQPSKKLDQETPAPKLKEKKPRGNDGSTKKKSVAAVSKPKDKSVKKNTPVINSPKTIKKAIFTPPPVALGTFQAFVTPVAEVYLGDKYLGLSSQVFKRPISLKRGAYKLIVKKQGYEFYERDILIKERQNLSLGRIDLQKITYHSLAVQGPKGTKFSVRGADGRFLKSLTLV